MIERRSDEAYGNIDPSSDTLRFGEGITADDLAFARRGDDMVISHSNGTDQTTVQNWFQEPTDHFKINTLEFEDGSTLTDSVIEERMVTYGTDEG